jgi:alpha-tubulin suppressor-like RCC1 family protein
MYIYVYIYTHTHRYTHTHTYIHKHTSQVCAKDSTAAITDTGRLYAWGKGVTGKLGLGNVRGNVVVPMRLDAFSNKPVCLVALGRNHSVCLLDDHRFYAWGSNTFGQLGLPDITTYINVPHELSSLRETNIRHIACGGWHTLICSWSGAVFTCGKGWHGQLGQGDYESLTAQSKTLPYFKKIMNAFGDHKIAKVCLCVCVCARARTVFVSVCMCTYTHTHTYTQSHSQLEEKKI